MCSGLEIRPSVVVPNELGLFTTKCFPKGSTICEYSGRRLSLAQALKVDDRSYMMGEQSELYSAGEVSSLGGFGINCHIDAKYSFNVWGRYINDCKDSQKLNARFIKDKDRKVADIVATRDIPVSTSLELNSNDCHHWIGR